MQWTKQQDEAMRSVANWLNDWRTGAPGRKPFFYLAGYAGTGKTTLARHLMQGVSGLVLYGAYTGKAAHVLQKNGCPNAMTIHQMMYKPKEKGKSRLLELETSLARAIASPPINEPFVTKLKKDIEDERNRLARPSFGTNDEGPIKSAKAIVLDECSMIDEPMGEDILRFGKPVLVLGDPAQLPPIYGQGFFTRRKPDYVLTDIRRQALDNPIIKMATVVREGERLSLGNYGDSRVVMAKEVTPDEAIKAGQILVGRNATRRATNLRCRQLLNRMHQVVADLPVEGDQVVCLNNNRELGLLNGGLWRLRMDAIYNEADDQVVLSLEDEARQQDCIAWAPIFMRNGRKIEFYELKGAEQFDYGYALTVHKAQGSQWDNVLLYDESFAFSNHRKEWLYTGITRAAERVTVGRL